MLKFCIFGNSLPRLLKTYHEPTQVLAWSAVVDFAGYTHLLVSLQNWPWNLKFEIHPGVLFVLFNHVTKIIRQQRWSIVEQDIVLNKFILLSGAVLLCYIEYHVCQKHGKQ